MTDAIDELERLHAAGPYHGFKLTIYAQWPALLSYVRALEVLAEQAENFSRAVDGYDMQRDALSDAQDVLDAARARLNGGK